MIPWNGRATRGTPGGPPLSMPEPGGAQARGLSSFHPVASAVHERTQPGTIGRGASAWAPRPPHGGPPPCLGPSGGKRPRGARKARRFSPRKSLKNGPLRYALTRRPEQSGGTHPLKGVRPEKIQRKRGQKNEIHHQEENETGKADRLRRPKAYVPTRAKT